MQEKRFIWINSDTVAPFAEFQTKFTYTGGSLVLRVCAEYRFAAYLNGAFVANSQYHSHRRYLNFSEYDVTALTQRGENILHIECRHLEQGYSQYEPVAPFLCFELYEDGKLITCSDSKTQGRVHPHYTNGDLITLQYGLGYHYDFTAPETEWRDCVEIAVDGTERVKPIKNTLVKNRIDCKILEESFFAFRGGSTSAELMQRAELSPTLARRDGLYILGDLGKECAGFPYFTVYCQERTTGYLGWGEHICDGRARTYIEGRNFAVKITLQKGENVFCDYLTRLGGRYLALYLQTEQPVELRSFGLIEELYPLKKEKKHFENELHEQIYETGRRTLELCMHEHYEDCPWREQALYGMDSRNQMLFGYGAFEEYDFARASLVLLAESVRADGLLEVSPPSKTMLTIPSFSVYWILAIYENATRDYDGKFVKQVLPAVEAVLNCCKRHTDADMVHTFQQDYFWNFHEWSQGLDGNGIYKDAERTPVPDGGLTALTYRACHNAAWLARAVGEEEKATQFEDYAAQLAKSFDLFYDAEKGLFCSYLHDGKKVGYHELTQALFLNTDALSTTQSRRMVEVLTHKQENLVPITFGGLALKYEALLRYGNCPDYLLQDVTERFAKLLQAGATSFWETEWGEADFNGAGSLCHGWAALGCYVLDSLDKTR